MGARPIASLNSLRFGSLENPRVRYLFDGVVRGIGDYGNSFGVPTVGGEVYFDPSYEGNPLVNAMSVGVVEVGQTASAIAEGVGNRFISLDHLRAEMASTVPLLLRKKFQKRQKRSVPVFRWGIRSQKNCFSRLPSK